MRHTVTLLDQHTGRWLEFTEPVSVLSAHEMDDVIATLRAVEALVERDGLWAAGFVSYDAAPAFDSALRAQPGTAVPLVWFGLFREPATVDMPPPIAPATPIAWTPTVTRDEYDAAIAAIKSHIADGDTYQVNYTFRLNGTIAVSGWDLFRELVHAQASGYAAFIDTGAHTICSVSPELFFAVDGRTLTSRPMKGTARRGRFSTEDEAQAAWLQASEKNRAENVMIVDMIRNDIGRVADVGSVAATDLFRAERYPTLWQMTSTVKGQTGASITDIMRALFPCASITGAPKARTTAIISALETTPRGLYTGAVGFIAPNRRAQFNVAIRTVTIDNATGIGEYGVGGGVTWESNAVDEYDECLTKARVLTERQPPFELLETLRWTPLGFSDADAHIDRMSSSARYFGIHFDRGSVRAALMHAATSFQGDDLIARLCVDHRGVARVETRPFVARHSPVRLTLSPFAVDSTDVFLFHKTTHRAVYESAQRACPDADDVLLWNERGEITESCISNVVISLDGLLVTPPVTCGLLAGTRRSIRIGAGDVHERVLTIDDVLRAEEIWLINSVRGDERAVLVPGPYDDRVGAPS